MSAPSGPTSENTMTPLMNGEDSKDSLFANRSDRVKYRGRKCHVILTPSNLSIMDAKKPVKALHAISCADIIGSTFRHTNRSSKKELVLTVTYYPVKSGCCSSNKDGKTRSAQHINLVFCDNELGCTSLQNAINSVSQNQFQLILDEPNRECVLPPVQRRFVVIVNPVGGKGQGLRIWKKNVLPMLQAANVDIHLVVTERANHAKDEIAALDVSTVNAILAIGGDGIVFEVVNGFMCKDNGWDELQRTPIVHIPGGSANGLAKSVLYASGEACTPRNATFVALKGTASPLDLSEIVTKADNVRHLSFLCFSFGLVSDIDILSESMRCLGEMRMYIAAVYFIAKKKMYKGKLRMKLVGSSTDASSEAVKKPTSEKENEPSVMTSPVSAEDIEGEGMPPPTLSSSTVYGTASPTTPILPAPANNLEGNDDAKVRDTIEEQHDPQEYSPTEGWITVEGNFTLVWALQTSHAASTMMSGPGVQLNDGIFTVFVVQKCSRLQMLSLLLVMDTGGHVDHPMVHTYRCTDYVLEPYSEKAILAVDGEVVETGRVEAKVLPGAARIMTLN